MIITWDPVCVCVCVFNESEAQLSGRWVYNQMRNQKSKWKAFLSSWPADSFLSSRSALLLFSEHASVCVCVCDCIDGILINLSFYQNLILIWVNPNMHQMQNYITNTPNDEFGARDFPDKHLQMTRCVQQIHVSRYSLLFIVWGNHNLFCRPRQAVRLPSVLRRERLQAVRADPESRLRVRRSVLGRHIGLRWASGLLLVSLLLPLLLLPWPLPPSNAMLFFIHLWQTYSFKPHSLNAEEENAPPPDTLIIHAQCWAFIL